MSTFMSWQGLDSNREVLKQLTYHSSDSLFVWCCIFFILFSMLLYIFCFTTRMISFLISILLDELSLFSCIIRYVLSNRLLLVYDHDSEAILSNNILFSFATYFTIYIPISIVTSTIFVSYVKYRVFHTFLVIF